VSQLSNFRDIIVLQIIGNSSNADGVEYPVQL
jgi:hypothetical protein